MLNAIENAGLDEGMIDVVLAHATGTPMGDEAEAKALFKYASDPDVGPRAGWPAHKSEEELYILRVGV